MGDAQRLGSALRDLVALSAVPAAWVGREPRAIVAGFVDVLLKSLHLDFAFVRLCDPIGGAAVEIAKAGGSQTCPEWLQQYVSDGRISHQEIVRGIGTGGKPCLCILIPIGVDAESGLVAAACDRDDFPGENDQLLLSVAANHAATAFRMARLVDAHRRAEEALRESEQELRKARDELELKVAERTAELQRSEAYLAEAQKLSHAGSFGWDISSGKLFWSEETFRIFEYDGTSQPTVELVLERTHPDDRARVQRTIDQAREDKKALDFEHRLLMPDETIKDVHVVGHPIFDRSGDFVEFMGTVIDVTRRRRAEEERQALAYAQRITTMGQLTASIAHEVNQPIAGIIVNAQLALSCADVQPPDLGEIRQALGRIVRDGTRAGDIVGRIRSLIAKAPPRKTELDINDTILEVIALTHTEVHRNGISLNTRLAPNLPLVEGDRVQLQQVMLNLILNAVQALSATNTASRELVVSTEDGGTNGVCIAVWDSGPGVAPESFEHLFNAFYTTKPGGMGIGLSICRSIVEAHGGRMWAAANIPQGALFQFTLPVCPGL